MDWDPQQYALYDDERARSFVELLARVRCAAPRRVVDLGCGTGVLTALLARRWPDATVVGVDSSRDMVAAAAPGVAVELGAIEDWTYPRDADVVVSNAALQWVPSHLPLLASWIDEVPDEGWLAWQVPGNFEAPSHSLMRDIAASYGIDHVLRHGDAVGSTADYAELLLAGGLEADVWETTYLHVLHGPDPVLEWVRGTGLRPVLAVLDGDRRDEFVAEYAAALRTAYPARDGVTLFPFRRVFAVGHRPKD